MAEVQGGKLKKFVVKNFLVLGFVLGCVWALVWPEPGHLFYHAMVGSWKIVSTINMMIIFLIFGATLETQELKAAFKEWKALILGLVSILVLTSLTGFVFMEIPFKPQEFGLGLAIFACVPTSLSQSVSVVIQGYGNGALSLLFTVSTNILGIFISPVFVKLVLGSKLPDVSIDAVDLLVKLSVSIIIPLIVGKTVRELVPGAKAFCKKYKVPLYLFNNFQIIMIVWMTLSYSQHHLLQQKFYDIIIAIIAAIMQHFSFLVMNTLIAWMARLPDAERKSFIVSSSQKSLPTAAVLIAYLPPSVGEVGLVSIPCIVFYIMQLFIDSFIAKSWASKYEKALELQAKYKEQLQDLAEQNPDAPSLEKQTSIVDKALVVDTACVIDGSPTPLTVEPLCPVPLPSAAESDRALLLGSVVRSDTVAGTNAASTTH